MFPIGCCRVPCHLVEHAPHSAERAIFNSRLGFICVIPPVCLEMINNEFKKCSLVKKNIFHMNLKKLSTTKQSQMFFFLAHWVYGGLLCTDLVAKSNTVNNMQQRKLQILYLMLKYSSKPSERLYLAEGTCVRNSNIQMELFISRQ